MKAFDMKRKWDFFLFVSCISSWLCLCEAQVTISVIYNCRTIPPNDYSMIFGVKRKRQWIEMFTKVLVVHGPRHVRNECADFDVHKKASSTRMQLNGRKNVRQLTLFKRSIPKRSSQSIGKLKIFIAFRFFHHWFLEYLSIYSSLNHRLDRREIRDKKMERRRRREKTASRTASDIIASSIKYQEWKFIRVKFIFLASSSSLLGFSGRFSIKQLSFSTWKETKSKIIFLLEAHELKCFEWNYRSDKMQH